jgi:hypothetical protein
LAVSALEAMDAHRAGPLVGGLALRDRNLLHLVRSATIALKISVPDLRRFQKNYLCCDNLKRVDEKARRRNIWVLPLLGINQKQSSWNKRESDAVWKSMKDSKQLSDRDMDNTPALDLGETEFSSIVAAGGGKYVGVLKEIPNKMESIVLFNSPRTRTTLAFGFRL